MNRLLGLLLIAVSLPIAEARFNPLVLSPPRVKADATLLGFSYFEIKVVTYSNQKGAGPLSITNLAITGPDAFYFSEIGNTCVGVELKAGDTCWVTLQYSAGPIALASVTSATLEIRGDFYAPIKVNLCGETNAGACL